MSEPQWTSRERRPRDCVAGHRTALERGLLGSQAAGQEAVTVTCAGKKGLNSDVSGPRDEGVDVQAAEEMRSIRTGE